LLRSYIKKFTKGGVFKVKMIKRILGILVIGLLFFCPLVVRGQAAKMQFSTPENDQIWIGVKEIKLKFKNMKLSELLNVSVYLDGKLVKEFSSPPYSFKYNFGQRLRRRKLEALAETVYHTKLRCSIRSYDADDFHTVNVMQVVVPVVVLDRGDKYVGGLTKDDFILTEDGVEQEISHFSTGGKSTFHLVMVVDISSSMKDKIAHVKEVAKLFLKELLQKDDKAIIVFFNHDVFEDSDFTSDINELDNSLSIAFPFGATALYDAIAYSVKLLKSIIGQNIIIIFSDGEDNSSAIDPYTLMKIVERSNSVIYSIGTGDDSERFYNQYQELLEKISTSSGGMTFFYNDLSDIEKLYKKIRQDIRAKYVIQFSPKNGNKQNRFRKISVRVRGKKRYKVRTMKGYYY
jgi:Ca-activated chloride channel family protein